MEITKAVFTNMLRQAAEMMIGEEERLSEIDSRFGDGDHGVAIKKIAGTTLKALEGWEEQGTKGFLDDLGTALMGVGGGAAGPLWGTMISGLGLPLSAEAQEMDAVMLKACLQSALEEMQSISAAKVGDKTMMDVLIPAVAAAQQAPDETLAVLEAAAAAAEQGAKDTEKYPAKYGRAKNYKDQTIGTPDAGAISLMVFFKGLAIGAKDALPAQ